MVGNDQVGMVCKQLVHSQLDREMPQFRMYSSVVYSCDSRVELAHGPHVTLVKVIQKLVRTRQTGTGDKDASSVNVYDERLNWY